MSAVWFVSQDDLSDTGVSDPAASRFLGVFSTEAKAERFVAESGIGRDAGLNVFVDRYEVGETAWSTDFEVTDS